MAPGTNALECSALRYLDYRFAEGRFKVVLATTGRSTMPAPVKFSEEFYQQFGHRATDELADWMIATNQMSVAELRSLNEANAARFEAKLERLRAGIIKWMFVFWAGTMLTLVGVMVALLKL